MTTPEDHLAHVRRIAMTDDERSMLRARLYAYAIANPPSPSVPLAAWHWVLRHGALTVGLAALLIVGGTGVSAHGTRPGDLLYGFRLSVNDRVETAFALGEEARIDAELGQIQRLLDDEETRRETELGAVLLTAEDRSDGDLERELRELERQLSEETHILEQEFPSAVRTTQPFDDSSFERELRELERELDAELELGTELEL
jgi:hypothetical protein